MEQNLEFIKAWHANPLLQGILKVGSFVAGLKEQARQYYYAVLLSRHTCPTCGGPLRMTGPSQCQCRCGVTLDPTTQFQKSPCCSAPLVRKVLHYVCSSCQRIIPSKFLFDERLFDREYFRQRMQASRQHQANKREELRLLLTGTRSSALYLSETPELSAIPGLEMELDRFVSSMDMISIADFLDHDEFRMEQYWKTLQEDIPPGCLIRFSALPFICENRRLDRARKFLTLLFMEQAQEVKLAQDGNDIIVERQDEIDRER